MIYVFEGPEGAGKTTLAHWASEELGVPMFYDSCRHGVLGDLSASEWMLTGTQHNSDVAEFSTMADFVVDRWVLTSWVYDGWRDCRASGAVYERIVANALVRVYLLDASVDVLLDRISRRTSGSRRGRDVLERFVGGFRRAAVYFRELGLDVRMVNTNRPKEEVRDEIRSDW